MGFKKGLCRKCSGTGKYFSNGYVQMDCESCKRIENPGAAIIEELKKKKKKSITRKAPTHLWERWAYPRDPLRVRPDLLKTNKIVQYISESRKISLEEAQFIFRQEHHLAYKIRERREMAYKKEKNQFSQDMADDICLKIASCTKSIAQLCRENPDWPEAYIIYTWLRRYPHFKETYFEARSDQVEVCVDTLQDYINEDHYYVDENGNQRVDTSLMRVKVDAIKWKAGKLLPKKYGATLLENFAAMKELDEECTKRFAELKKDEKY